MSNRTRSSNPHALTIPVQDAAPMPIAASVNGHAQAAVVVFPAPEARPSVRWFAIHGTGASTKNDCR